MKQLVIHIPKILILISILFLLPVATSLAAPKAFIQALKADPKGPFQRIRWFCNDGTLLPPNGSCREHGGGIQHADWKPEIAELRNKGLPIATIYAALTENDFYKIVHNQSVLPAMLVERYLITADNGWIYRKSKFYRGALQFEDESIAAHKLLTHMLSQKDWVLNNFLLARESVRLLPLEKDSSIMSEIRGLANSISQLDSSFLQLRNKIHSIPGLSDAAAVRDWALKQTNKNIVEKSNTLAIKIERAFGGNLQSTQMLDSVIYSPVLQQYPELKELVTQLNSSIDSAEKLKFLSELLLQIRYTTQKETSLKKLRELLDISIEIEGKAYQYAVSSVNSDKKYTRLEGFELLRYLTRAVFGTGMLSKRSYFAAEAAISRLLEKEKMSSEDYWKELSYLANVPVWGSDEYSWYFGSAVKKFAELDPIASLFAADRMRGSMMAVYSLKLENLLTDAANQVGIIHDFFNKKTASGLKILNPGIARGKLVDLEFGGSDYDKNSIVIVPEIIPELKSVAGIITARAGNSLSHVQLLAANAGIPNIVVSSALIDQLKSYTGSSIVIAASYGGKVLITNDNPKWTEIINNQTLMNEKISLNTRKLDLEETDLLTLADVDSDDSGKRVGPKAAELGELKDEFPDSVSNAIVIPFGVYASMLNLPYKGEANLKTWISKQFSQLNTQTLANIRRAIESIKFNENFKNKLAQLMNKELGVDGSYGVFVRSDTNVEDLPNFTGAGLNRTVPNVVGFDNVLDAIVKVWASPFTERAYLWREKHLRSPEDVYVSVLLHKAVPCELSGVLITENIENGDREQFTVATNYGVGGAVAAQDSETVIIDRDSGNVRLLSESTGRFKKILLPDGGLDTKPVTERRILSVEQLLILHKFVKNLYSNFSEFEDEDGEELPFDVEFGFIGNKLYLFQIRPYVKNTNSEFHPFLRSLDKNSTVNKNKTILLNQTLN